MKQFLLYGHGGAYNHGAEAIVKTTIKLIRAKYSDAYIAVSSHFPNQDKEHNIDADEFFSPISEIWYMEKSTAVKIKKEQLAQEMYRDALSYIQRDTICLSVGGDNFCYPNWHRQSVFQHEIARQNAKSILWGCSVEPSTITHEMAGVLATYTHILTRESITYHTLHDLGINTDIQFLPDPAFLLEPKPLELPDGFYEGNIIGINISPLILRREPVSRILIQNMRNLIDYIFSETNMGIVLIPHVVMPMDNDYSVLSKFEQEIPAHLSSRVWMMGGEFSAAQYKSVISKCSLLVCSRTHASIAAYSSGVPALVIGYSVKSSGIAKDLGMDEFVLNVGEVKSPNIVMDMFGRLYSKADEIKSTLSEKLRYYIRQANDYADYI